jgi:hypothetical protein
MIKAYEGEQMSAFSELWVVWGPPEEDGLRYPQFCAGWPEACHEHINDAINEHDIAEAVNWIVREHGA